MTIRVNNKMYKSRSIFRWRNVHFIRFLLLCHHMWVTHKSELESLCFNLTMTRPPWQKIDTHQPDLRASQVAVKTLHFRHVAVRSPWWTDHYEILTLHPTDGSSGWVTCDTPFPFSVSVFKHIKAALISPLNHQLSRHSSTMRMSGLTSVSTLLVISALAGSIYLAEVSMIQ